MSEPKWLNLEDFEYLCFDLARALLSYGEPIPDYETRDQALLASALGVPKHTYGGDLLYPTLPKQGAALFYSLIKNHPFKNGNKRIALMGLLVFLGLNKKWLNIGQGDLYDLAIDVSNSDPAVRDSMLERIEQAITDHMIAFPQKPIQ